MKPFFISLFIGLSVCAWSQPNKLLNKDSQKLISTDSMVHQLKEMSDSVGKITFKMDTARTREEAERNGVAILQLHKDLQAKQKKAAITRIAIGAGFLVILIIGLMRRRKK